MITQSSSDLVGHKEKTKSMVLYMPKESVYVNAWVVWDISEMVVSLSATP